MFKVLFPNEQEAKEIPLKEFELAMQFRYLPKLDFEKENYRDIIRQRVARLTRKNLITVRQKWFGTYFCKEIEQNGCPKISFRWISATIGYGVFAEENIISGTYIGEYTGILRKRKWLFGIEKNDYGFDYSLGETLKAPFIIDAKLAGNHTRFINHSDQPNLEPLSALHGGLLHIILRAHKAIPKGEQLTYDYGPDYWTRGRKKLF